MAAVRRDHGQGTVEWVGLVTVIAVLVAAGTALAQAAQLGATVSRQLARAYCVVRGGDCERDREPCVVRSWNNDSALGLHVLLLDIGRERRLAIEHLSDGTIRVTRLRAADLGGGPQLGATLRAGRLGAGANLSVGAAIRLGAGSSWIVRSETDLARMLPALIVGGRLPEPQVRSATVGTMLGADLSASAGRLRNGAVKPSLALTGGFDVAREDTVGIDRRTGHRTILLGAETKAALALTAGRRTLWSERIADGGPAQIALELDGAGRPLDLKIVTVGDRPAPPVRGATGLSEPAPEPGRRRSYETTTHLDLTDPANGAALRDFLAALHGGVATAPRALDALARRIEEQGTVEARTYDRRDAAATHLVASVAAAIKLGAAIDATGGSARLVAAASRGLDGRWLPREDCTGTQG